MAQLLSHWLSPLEATSASALSKRLALFAGVVYLGLISHGHYAASGDAIHYMVIAHSVAFDHDLSLANNYDDHQSIIDIEAGTHARPGLDGILRPVHDIGIAVAAAPVYALSYRLAELSTLLPESLRKRGKLEPFIVLRQLISVFMIVVTALLGVVFFHACVEATGDRAWSFLWACLFIVSPPILTHGYVFFTEIPTALVALSAYQLRSRLQSYSWLGGAVIGLLIGVLPIFHVRNVGLAGGLLISVLLCSGTNAPRIAGLFGGFGLMAGVRVLINWLFWRSAFSTPHAYVGSWSGVGPFTSEATLRGFGLLFDVRHGLLPFAPIFLLAPAAWVLFCRRQSMRAVLASVIPALCYLALILAPSINVHGWRGGWSPAARFLVPVVVFAAIPVPLLFSLRRARGVVLTLAGIQLVIDAVCWGYPMLTWTGDPGPAPLYEMIVGQALVAKLPVWSALSADAAAAATAMFAGWLALTWLLVRSSEGPSQAVSG